MPERYWRLSADPNWQVVAPSRPLVLYIESCEILCLAQQPLLGRLLPPPWRVLTADTVLPRTSYEMLIL